jgi:hypothetical protein
MPENLGIPNSSSIPYPPTYGFGTDEAKCNNGGQNTVSESSGGLLKKVFDFIQSETTSSANRLHELRELYEEVKSFQKISPDQKAII